MAVMGIDPGQATVGWGVVDYRNSELVTLGYGAIRTPKGMSQPERLEFIYHRIQELLKEYSPDYVAIEELFFSRNVTSAMAVAEARGVIQLAVHTHRNTPYKIPMENYKPNTIKKAVTGSGRASKEEVQRAVQMYLGMEGPVKPDDAADALAVAITHITSEVR